ncbi:unnamed protein product [Lepeophtheirus salmonis]|uniref:(salmon louse) hypothetical protein n=1 Tax=Lepeophtheirus salmonis TaxID=72036 RepID=A0A7R8CPM4_LEPSM|nr:unnamed protein product [Lepeophtheirus salmonis]CAF2850212.1 unnamed protein product [Lepeophtheirus salmonis]
MTRNTWKCDLKSVRFFTAAIQSCRSHYYEFTSTMDYTCSGPGCSSSVSKDSEVSLPNNGLYHVGKVAKGHSEGHKTREREISSAQTLEKRMALHHNGIIFLPTYRHHHPSLEQRESQLLAEESNYKTK